MFFFNCVLYFGLFLGFVLMLMDMDGILLLRVNFSFFIGNYFVMVFMFFCMINEEWSNILVVISSGIVLFGSVVSGKMGLFMGVVDVGEFEDKYMFRVVLLGVSSVESKIYVWLIFF